MPLSVAKLVTVPEVRSVIEREDVLETLKLSVVDCPALMAAALALNVLMAARGVTVIERSRVTEPALLVIVRR